MGRRRFEPARDGISTLLEILDLSLWPDVFWQTIDRVSTLLEILAEGAGLQRRPRSRRVSTLLEILGLLHAEGGAGRNAVCVSTLLEILGICDFVKETVETLWLVSTLLEILAGRLLQAEGVARLVSTLLEILDY